MTKPRMTYKERLLDQLKASYPGVDISHDSDKRDEIHIVNFPCDGVDMEISGKFEAFFSKFDKVNYLSLQTYWQPRLKHEGTRILFDPKKLCILLDRKFPDTEQGQFERAMWTFRVIDYIQKEIRETIDDLAK